uniref:Uncharacterized protein n=2 Tax=Clytia hemisphaerica TaxID=252671 RepID=A0A7M5WX18_9CNID
SVNIESCEHLHIEMILSRYARKLLSNYSLVDLGTFAAHLEFDLTPWLTKERFRAACVDNFIRAMSYTHDYFEWDYPKCNAVPTLGRGVSQISASTLQSTSEIATPTTPIESELGYPNTTVDGEIEARLLSIRDENEPCDTFSDSVSIMTSLDEMSNADGRGNMAATSPPTMSEIMTVLDQKHHLVKHRSTEKLKYLLNVFAEARCLDWVIIFTLILCDLNTFNHVLEKVSAFKDMTKSRLDMLMSSLEDLNDWLEEKWYV